MKVESVELTNLAVRISQYPTDGKYEFLLVGRSNVGKSSFINALINRKNFAHTSSNPGKTQTLNFYLVNNLFYLVDVPGYGYANVDKQTQKKFGLMIEEYLKTRENLERSKDLNQRIEGQDIVISFGDSFKILDNFLSKVII